MIPLESIPCKTHWDSDTSG